MRWTYRSFCGLWCKMIFQIYKFPHFPRIPHSDPFSFLTQIHDRSLRPYRWKKKKDTHTVTTVTTEVMLNFYLVWFLSNTFLVSDPTQPDKLLYYVEASLKRLKVFSLIFGREEALASFWKFNMLKKRSKLRNHFLCLYLLHLCHR